MRANSKCPLFSLSEMNDSGAHVEKDDPLMQAPISPNNTDSNMPESKFGRLRT